MRLLIQKKVGARALLCCLGFALALFLLDCDCNYLGGPGSEKKLEKQTEQILKERPRPEPRVEPVVVERVKEKVVESGEPVVEPRREPPKDGGTKESEPVVEKQPDAGPVEVRSCKTTFRFDARNQSGINSVAVAGEFNQWSTSTDLLKDDDGDQIWEISLQIPAGGHAYKIVINGNDWRLDPGNPERKYHNNTENSLVVVSDCTAPLLRLDSLLSPAGKGEIDVLIRYLDGADQKGFDVNSLRVTINGKAYKGVSVSGGRISMRLTGQSPDRYTFRVNVSDKSGKKAEELYFFVWVQDKVFRWQDAILYFAFVDRFFNGDASNDKPIQGVGQIANYMGGDLKGVLEKLKGGYFSKMGINAIWLSPIYDNVDRAERGSDGRMYTGFHGYWPIEGRKIEPRYGDWDSLRLLVREAHKQGVRVLVDLASNHVHSDHPYWINNQNKGWFHPKSSCAPNWDRPIECWFDSFLPDVDYRNFDAASAMIGDAVYWAKEGELDGFRVDAVKHMRSIFTYNLRAALERKVTHGFEHFYMVGETFSGAWKDGGGQVIKPYVSPTQLSGQFDFPIYWEILGAIGRREGGFGFQRLDGVVQEVADKQFYGAGAVMSNFIGNHDVPRFISHAAGQISQMFTGDRNKAWQNPPGDPQQQEPYERLKLAFSLMMALPGIPLIYYGDEIAMPGETDPDNRRMMKFSGLSSQQTGVLAHVQKVSLLRAKHPALRSYSRKTLHVSDEWYVFLREDATSKEKIIVVLRRGGATSTFEVPVQGLVQDGQAAQDLLRGASLQAAQGKIKISLNANEGTYLLLP